jgi:hypothetical protein
VENGPCAGPTSFGSFKNMIAPLQNKTPAAGLPTFYFPVLGNHDDNWGDSWYPDPFGHGFCDVFDPIPLVPNHTQQPYYLDPAATRYTDVQFYSLACSKTVSDVYPGFIHYSFNYRNSHFVVLRINNDSFDIEACNSCGPNRSNYGDYYNIHQLDWLRAGLAAASANAAIDHIFVSCTRRSSRAHGDTGECLVADLIQGIQQLQSQDGVFGPQPRVRAQQARVRVCGLPTAPRTTSTAPFTWSPAAGARIFTASIRCPGSPQSARSRITT